MTLQVLADENNRYMYDRYGEGWDRFKPIPNTLLTRVVGLLITETIFSAVTPLDTISKRAKIISLSSVGNTTAKAGPLSLYSLFRSIKKEEGWKGLYKGGIFSITSNVIYTTLSDKLSSKVSPISSATLAFLASYPFELISTCLRTNIISNASFSTIKQVFLSNGIWTGIRRLYSGLVPFMLHNATLIYGSYLLDTIKINEWVEDKLRKRIEKNEYGKALFYRLGFSFMKMIALSAILSPLKTITLQMQIHALDIPVTSTVVGTATLSLGNLYSGFMADCVLGFGTMLINAFI